MKLIITRQIICNEKSTLDCIQLVLQYYFVFTESGQKRNILLISQFLVYLEQNFENLSIQMLALSRLLMVDCQPNRSFFPKTIDPLLKSGIDFIYRNMQSCVRVCAVVQSLSCVQLFVTPQTAASRTSCPSLSFGICSDSCPLSR